MIKAPALLTIAATIAVSGCGALPTATRALSGGAGDAVEAVAQAGDARTAAALRGPCAATLGGVRRVEIEDPALGAGVLEYSKTACVDRADRMPAEPEPSAPEEESPPVLAPSPPPVLAPIPRTSRPGTMIDSGPGDIPMLRGALHTLEIAP